MTASKQSQDGTAEQMQRRCPKHVEFYDRIKFGQLVRLVGY